MALLFEHDFEGCPLVPVELNSAIKLIHQHVDNLHPQCLRVTKIQVLWKSHAVIADDEAILIALRAGKANTNLARPPIGKGMFQGIGDKLVDDQSARNGRVDVQKYFLHVHAEFNGMRMDLVGLEQVQRQAVEVLRKINIGQVFGKIEFLVDKGHRPDPALTLFKHIHGGWILDFVRLKIQQAGHNLHIIFDPMMDLSEEDFFLRQGCFESLFRPFPFDGHRHLG